MYNVRKQNHKQIKLALKLHVSLMEFCKTYAKMWRESNHKRSR